MIVHCTYCCDEYDPVEYRPVNDPDEPHFCSADCEDAFLTAEEFTEMYKLSRYGGAPVF